MLTLLALASALDRGAAAYKAGDFVAAQAAYTQAVATSPRDASARLGLGRLELYRDQFDAAERDLTAAAGTPATAPDAHRYLDQVRTRRAEFGRYDATLAGRTLRIPFVQRDPLPMVAVAVNGRPAHFLIDTGAPDVVVDPDFAREIGATVTAAGSGVFAGGRRAPVSHTSLATFSLGGADFADLQATVLPTRGLPFGGAIHIDGVIGTGFLAHFLATLDYAHSALVLAPRASAPNVTGATVVPMWFVGDHFLFARGTINGVPMLMSVDTGLAGGGVLPSPETVKSAGLTLDTAHASQGMGGGGPVTTIPFVAKSVTLGTLARADVRGLYSPDGSPYTIFPFAVGAGISHGFFSPGTLTFDFTRMQLILTP